jgi:hypothetical protein
LIPVAGTTITNFNVQGNAQASIAEARAVLVSANSSNNTLKSLNLNAATATDEAASEAMKIADNSEDASNRKLAARHLDTLADMRATNNTRNINLNIAQKNYELASKNFGITIMCSEFARESCTKN